MDASVAVVGPGAIGTVVAAALHAAGRTPLLFGRTARDHLELVDASGRIVVPGPVQTDPRAVTDPVDVVLLAVKATQVPACAPWLAVLCRPGTVVCVLQNGVEQVRSLAPHVAGADVVPSVVWFPAETQHDGTVWLRATPRLTLPDGPGTGALLRALDGTRVEVDVAQDFTSVAWRKLLQNAVAGLMVLTGRRAGMFARDDLARLAHDYLRECLLVARAEGADLGDDVPDALVEQFRGSPVDMGTSILADRIAGNPLEWDVRNGVVQRLGAAHGIPTPVSHVLVPLLAAASDGPG
ncbi:ketopantoate reductase [Curtobacterium sp. 9128]|uniref:oxidoreductase n=1 Tax=Curtobacterium sp. 9128 TaxID=1793722 RepID=UPI0007D7253D|nr:oxidoreductase [Curtobacterium sp. 9128]SBN63733.1 ketopantoate reductase [Curtobacterium sp. 9128]